MEIRARSILWEKLINYVSEVLTAKYEQFCFPYG